MRRSICPWEGPPPTFSEGGSHPLQESKALRVTSAGARHCRQGSSRMQSCKWHVMLRAILVRPSGEAPRSHALSRRAIKQARESFIATAVLFATRRGRSPTRCAARRPAGLCLIVRCAHAAVNEGFSKSVQDSESRPSRGAYTTSKQRIYERKRVKGSYLCSTAAFSKQNIKMRSMFQFTIIRRRRGSGSRVRKARRWPQTGKVRAFCKSQHGKKPWFRHV